MPKPIRYYFYHRREAWVFAYYVGYNLGCCACGTVGKEDGRNYSPYYAEYQKLSPYQRAKLNGAHEALHWGTCLHEIIWDPKYNRYASPNTEAERETGLAAVAAEEAEDAAAIENYLAHLRERKPNA